MHRSFVPLLGLLGAGLLSHDAHAAVTPTEQIGIGAGLTLGATAAHALVWGLYVDRQGPLGVHFVPVAGPIVGLREVVGTPCSSKHGCPARGMLVVSDSLYLAAQVGGLVTLGTALLRTDEPVSLHIQPHQITLQMRW
jgi:hypothetical protein